MGERMRKVSDSLDRDPARAPDGPGVSMILRNARLGRGEDLRTVANSLRIRFVYLQAIEDGRFSDLPGTAYAAGFLRSYAEHLELDADMIVRRFKDEAAGIGQRPELYFPTPVPEGRMPGGTILLGTLVLAGIVYGSWYYLSATDRSMVDYVPALPDRLVSLLDALPWSGNAAAPQTAEAPSVTVPVAPLPVGDTPTAAAPPVTVPSVATPTPAPAAGTAPAGPPPAPAAPQTATPAPAAPPAPATRAPVAAPAPSPAPAVPTATAPARSVPAPAVAPPPVPAAPAAAPQTATLPPPEDDEPEAATQEPTPLTPPVPAAPPAARPAETATAPTRVFGNTSAQARIQLRATQDSWIQVRDSSTNELLFTRVLRPGDVYRVPDKPGIRVRTGNAGGLIVVTDGMDGPPMGAVGQVLRDVPLDPPPQRQGSGTSH